MAGIGKYKGSGSFSMKGSTFYGKSPLYQKQDKKTYPKSYTEEDKKFCFSSLVALLK